MSEFNYCFGVPPPSELYAVKCLNSLEQNAFDDLVETIISSYKNVESKVKIISLKSKLGVEEYERIFQALKDVISKCLRKNLEASVITKDLQAIGLKEEYAVLLTEKLGEARLEGVVDAIRGNQLYDLRWKFGLASAEGVGSQHAFVDLYFTIGNTSGQKETVELELTLSQFYKFLNSIERAANIMQRYSVQ